MYMKTILKQILAVSVLSITTIPAIAQHYFSDAQKSEWLKKAQENTPELFYTTIKPEIQVDIVADKQSFQGYKAVNPRKAEGLYSESFKGKSGIVLDLGDHYTGYFTFRVEEFQSDSDAPIRLKFTFSEVPAELRIPFDPYKGTISRAWLQDEVVTIEQLPATIKIPRRLSCRYLQIDILGDSQYAQYRISDMKFVAQTSAKGSPAPLNTSDKLLREIDKVSQKTLRECMQTVFEDGPKRDHRLWIGDLYLQMLADNYTFQNRALAKRCLYILAGLCKDDGYLNHTIFETPVPHPQVVPILLYEYALIYNATLNDYLQETHDTQTALDLWPVAKRQIEKIPSLLDKDGLFDPEKANKQGLWQLVDWQERLDRQASEQGIYIFALEQTYQLAKTLGKEKEVAHVPALIKQMKKGAMKLYDKQKGVFVSGKDRQVSYASQTWMALAKVVDKEQGREILSRVFADSKAVKPGSPYLYHYVIQAMVDTGMGQEAKEAVKNYWGGMVQKGADTFWEVYDPDNDFISPYQFAPINSYCHAWSCTPIYFIRKYPEIFQK